LLHNISARAFNRTRQAKVILVLKIAMGCLLLNVEWLLMLVLISQLAGGSHGRIRS